MIHPTAIIDATANIGTGVEIGPYSVIGENVVIEEGCKISSHVVIQGPSHIGKDTQIFQFSSIGEIPQDKKFAGEETRLEIGERNVIREGCTLNRGTIQDKKVTKIGDDNWIMAYVHVAHDCEIGNHTILANNVALAGHVTVADYAILGGFTLVHQFCRIGAHSFTGMGSALSKDLPPFVMASGNLAKPYGLNTEGLKRRGYSLDEIKLVKQAYKIIYRSGNTLDEARQALRALAGSSKNVALMLEFLENVTRGIVR